MYTGADRSRCFFERKRHRLYNCSRRQSSERVGPCIPCVDRAGKCWRLSIFGEVGIRNVSAGRDSPGKDVVVERGGCVGRSGLGIVLLCEARLANE
jgi:hypothetical protein